MTDQKSKKRSKKLLIAAGGTGGHLFPGIAIADEIAAIDATLSIAFAGTARGLEATICPKRGMRLILMKSSSIKDRRGLSRLMAWIRLPLSLVSAIGILLRERPAAIVCIGGYAAGPLAIAAFLLCIPFVIVEPNAVAGFTNRMIGRFCKRAFIQFEEAEKYFPKGKSILSGNPVRKEVAALAAESEPHGEKLTIFAFGGSQGARRINQAMVDAIRMMNGAATKISVIHQTGISDDPAAIEANYRAAGVEANVFPFTDRIWECYAKADLVVARSGATTCAELMMLAKPSILVPYPFAADDHQSANAKGVERKGGAMVISDAELNGEKLARALSDFIASPTKLDQMRQSLLAGVKKNAAKLVAQELIVIMRY